MMTTMPPSPVNSLIDWLNEVPESIAAEFGGFILVLSPEGWFPQLQSLEDAAHARDWIVKHLGTWERNQQANVGGTLGVAAIVDFILSTRNSPERWTDLLDRNSQSLFRSRAIGSSLEDMLLRQRRRDEACAADWMRVATKWSEVRSNVLSTESIERWAREHFACFMGIGSGPAGSRVSDGTDASS